MNDKMLCLAPGCENKTESEYHTLCIGCEKRVEAAMLRARPSLMELMVTERAEAEAWLAAEWTPPRRWVIADENHDAELISTVVERMVDETAAEWGPPSLGFVDDELWARREEWRQKRLPDAEPSSPSAWLIPSDSPVTEAWRKHLTPILASALRMALSTFPLSHAGDELKTALRHQGDYDKDNVSDAFEDIWEGSGNIGLSDGAESYLELKYYPDETWMCEVKEWPEAIGAKLWKKYRVLSDEIVAILDALEQHQEQQERERSGRSVA